MHLSYTLEMLVSKKKKNIYIYIYIFEEPVRKIL